VDHELVQTALRVLRSVASHQAPTSQDIAILRSLIVEVDSSIPDDELACRVIENELAKRKVKVSTATA
jgi:hypothetical protein